MTILDKIIAHKKVELTTLKLPEKKLPRSPFSLLGLFQQKEFTVIHEYKRKTPSQGFLNGIPVHKQVQQYVNSGAKVVSVLTDERYFGGSYNDLRLVRESFPELILLNKEFIISKLQIDMADACGADVILLIATVLDQKALERLYNYAKRRGLDVIVEIHDEHDLEKVNHIKPEIVGINNRNLKTFSVDLSTTNRIAEQIDYSPFIISESGLASMEDIEIIRSVSHGVLIGSAFMKGELTYVI